MPRGLIYCAEQTNARRRLTLTSGRATCAQTAPNGLISSGGLTRCLNLPDNRHIEEMFEKGDGMKSGSKGFLSIDEYIATFPEDIQKKLEEMRATIKAAAPDAEEKISYQMPTFYQKGNLVHFAAFKTHIGFYPAPSGIEMLGDELARYQSGKGTLQFPIDQPLPLDLITRVVQFRVEENLAKAELKKASKKKK
jgi:uncharacterized protein YdhG (YjbR/CyaY superfamily)